MGLMTHTQLGEVPWGSAELSVGLGMVIGRGKQLSPLCCIIMCSIGHDGISAKRVLLCTCKSLQAKGHPVKTA